MRSMVRMGLPIVVLWGAAACSKKKTSDPAPVASKPTEPTAARDPVATPAPAEVPIDGATLTLGSARYRTGTPLRAARFLDDGTVIGLADGVVAVDAVHGAVRHLADLRGHALAVLPDGRIAVGGNDGISFVARDGSVTGSFPVAAGAVTSIAVTSDGTHLLLSGNRGAIIVVNASTGAEVERIPGGEDGYEDAAFLGSDQKIVASRGEALVVLERAGGKELARVALPQGVWAASPDGTKLATLAGGSPIDGYDVDLWNAADGKLIVGIHRERAVRAVAWTPDGATLLVGDEEGVVEGLRVGGGTGPKLSLHGGAIAGLAVSPDGERYAAITATGTVRIIDAAAGTASDPGEGHLGVVERLSFAGDRLISGGADHAVWTWELGGSRRVAKIELEGDLMAMTQAPDDQGIYVQVDVYARPAGEGYTSLSKHLIEGWTLSGARKFSHELDHGADSIKYCGYRKAIQQATGSTWKEIDPTSFEVTDRGRSTGTHGRLGPNGRFAAFQGHGALIVVDDDGTHRLATARCTPVKGVAFDQAGEVAAITDSLGTMRLWSTEGRLIGALHAAEAGGAADGVVLPDHQTTLYPTPTGILVWDQPKATVGKIALPGATSLAVTPEGDRVAVGFRDGRVGIFELAALRAKAQPLQTETAPEVTDDDCHVLRPEDYASSLGEGDETRFGDAPQDPGELQDTAGTKVP